MGCNCKQVKKITKNMPSFELPEYSKKGWKKILKYILKYLWHFIGCVVVLIFTIIATPIILVVAFFNYIKHGEMFITLPFLTKKSKLINETNKKE